MLLYFLIYCLFGMLWFGIIHKRISITNMLQPAFLYSTDGSIREFGVGYKNKTILPLWLTVIILAILSYFLIVCYINFNKFYF